MLDQTVSLPGLGVFYLKHISAQLDNRTNRFYPPKTQIRFKWKPKTKGERLIETLIDEYGLDHIAAEEALKTFSSELRQKLENNDEAILQGIGRLYKDQNGNLLFDGTRADSVFSRSFLPEFEFTPFTRQTPSVKKQKEAQKDEQTHATKPSPTADGSSKAPEDDIDWSDWDKADEPALDEHPTTDRDKPLAVADPKPAQQTQKAKPAQTKAALPLLPLFVLIGLGFLGLFTWSWYSKQKNTQRIQTSKTEIKLNQSPTQEISNPLIPVDSSIHQDTQNNNAASQTETTKKEQDSQKQQMQNPDETKDCVIIVGSFGRKSNANKMRKKIEQMGFDSYTDSQTLRLTRIGVKVRCAEAEGVLSEVQYKIEKSAWLLE